MHKHAEHKGWGRVQKQGAANVTKIGLFSLYSLWDWYNYEIITVTFYRKENWNTEKWNYFPVFKQPLSGLSCVSCTVLETYSTPACVSYIISYSCHTQTHIYTSVPTTLVLAVVKQILSLMTRGSQLKLSAGGLPSLIKKRYPAKFKFHTKEN